MKKTFSAIICLVLALSLGAQDARQRSIDTIVADVLAAMPAQNAADQATQMADLAASAPSSIVKVASMLKPAAAGVKNSAFEYALTGVASYASANPSVAPAVREGLAQAIKATDDLTNKEFLMIQLRRIATADQIALYKDLAQNPSLAAAAVGALVDIPGSDSAILDLVNAAKVDKSLLADAVSRKGLCAAEPALQSWAAASTGRELGAICSSLAKIGSASSLDLLKANSTADFADLAVKLADGKSCKAVAAAAKALLGSEVSAYKSAGALAQMKNSPLKAMKTLSAALKSDDVEFRNSVLNDAASIAGKDAVAALAQTMYPKLAEGAKADVINWIGSNKIHNAAPLVISAITNGGDLASTAIAAAGKLGGEDCLQAIASQLSGPSSAAALAALKSFKGDIQDAVGAAFDKELSTVSAGGKDYSSMMNIVNLISSRKLSGLAPRMYALAQSSDSKLALFGQTALSSVVGAADADKLSGLLDASTGDAEVLYRNALQSSLKTLSSQEQFEKVSGMIASAKNPSRFFSALACSGADNAVDLLRKSFDETGDKAAFNALCGIRNYKAADQLLAIAKGNPDLADRAVESFTSLVSDFEKDADVKCGKYAQALSIAKSADIKSMILNQVAALPTMKSFLLAGKFLDDAAVKMTAADAVRKIASATKEELDYSTLKTSLGKAAKAYTERGLADDEYAVKEIEKILGEAEPSPISELTAEEKKQGFEMLFDGTNLDKWQGDKEGYIPMNGTIYVSANYGSTGNLYTLKEYRNFVYRFEFCFLRPGVNNGVGIRTPMGVDAAYEGMCECQILDHDADIYASWLKEYQVHGSVYGVIPAKRLVHKPLGEWSTEEIRVEGDRITVTVNGQVIVDGNIRKACKGHNVAPDGSNENPYTVDHRNHPGMFNKTGYISFCGHGEGLKIRNVRILDLDK